VTDQKCFVKKIEWVDGKGLFAFWLGTFFFWLGSFLIYLWGNLEVWQILIVSTALIFSGHLFDSWKIPKLKSYWVEYNDK